MSNFNTQHFSYLSFKEAGAVSGYTHDYIGKLCRDGSLECRRMGRAWFVEEGSLNAFIVNQEHQKALLKNRLKNERKAEYADQERAFEEVLPEPVTTPSDEKARVQKGVQEIPTVLPVVVEAQPEESLLFESYRGEEIFNTYKSDVPATRPVQSVYAPSTLHTIVAQRSTLKAASVPAAHVARFLPVLIDVSQRAVALLLTVAIVFSGYALTHADVLTALGENAEMALSTVLDMSHQLPERVAYESTRIDDFVYESDTFARLAITQPALVFSGAHGLLGRLGIALGESVHSAALWWSAIPVSKDMFAFEGSRSGEVRVLVREVPVQKRTVAQKTEVQEGVSTSAVGSRVSTIINNPIVERIVERVIERPVVAQQTFTPIEINQKLEILENELRKEIFRMSSTNDTRPVDNFRMIALSQKIDQLNGTDISNATITGGSITGSAITASSFSTSGVLTFLGLDTGSGSEDVLVVGADGVVKKLSIASVGRTEFSALDDTDIVTPLSGQIAIYDGVDSWDNKTISGDATLTSDGTLSIATGVIGNDELAFDTGQALTTTSSPAFAGLSLNGFSGFLKATAGTIATALIDLTSDVTGILPDANVSDTLTIGTGSTVADGALSTNVSLLGQTITGSEIVDDSVDISDDTNLVGDSEIVLTNDTLSIGSSIARDSELHDAVTLAGALDYLTIVGQTITRNAIDLATDVTGILGITFGGTGANTASGARTNLGLEIGTDIQAYNANTSLIGQTIESSEITDATIVSGDIAPDTILASNIATGAVTTDEILNDTITDADIADNSLTAASLATNSVAADEIATGAVTTTEILDGTITTTDISATAAITDAQVNNNLTIDGGTINNTTIGATAPSTAVFTNATTTTLVATGTTTLATTTTTALSATTGTFSGALSGTSATFSSTLGALSAAITNGISAATATISGAFSAASATIAGLLTTGSLTVTTGGADITGGIDNNAGGISNTGAIGGATTINASGLITGTNGLTISSGAVALPSNSIESSEITDGTIDEADLDTSVNASLDLADSALQAAAIGVSVQAYNANTSLLGQTIESAEITDGTISASDLGTDSVGADEISANSVTLTTDTVGNYVATGASGNGVSLTGGGSEGATLTAALGALTANWNQTGAFDISLNNASSELSILESVGATFFGTLDVGDLAANATYTLSGATGTIYTTANDPYDTEGEIDAAVANNGYLTTAITSLNGLTGSTQTFVNDTNVTITSTGTTHTLGWSGTLADARVADALTISGGTISNSALTLVQSTTAAPTAEGRVEWDTDDNKLKVGDSVATITFSGDTFTLARANHTGTQTLSTISDAGALAALSTITSAYITDGTIDELDLDTSVNASLDLADSALQAGDNISTLTNDAGYLTTVDISANTNLAVGNGITLTGDTLTVTAAGGLAQTAGGLTTTGVLEDLNTLGANTIADQFLVSTAAGTLAWESGATARTSLGLGNVENTALSTWAGSTNITTLGTITAGTWNGTAIGDAYLTKTGNWTGTFDGYEGATLNQNIANTDLTLTGNRTLTLGANTLNIAGSTTGDFSVNTDDLFVDTSTGNVGIYTTSPSSALTIDSGVGGKSLSFGSYTYLGGAYSSADTVLGHMVRPIVGSSGLEKSTGITMAQSALIMNDGFTFATKAADSDAAGTAWSYATNAKMTLSNDGNLGIGTTLPGNPLHVEGVGVGTGAGYTLLRLFTTDNQGVLKGGGIDFGGKYTDAGAKTIFASIHGAKANGTNADFDGILTFATRKNGSGGTAERMRIDQDGNVGIGTTNPAYGLDVSAPVILLGADWGLRTRTNAAEKGGYIASTHYLNAEEPMSVIAGYSSVNNNDIYVGGGTSGLNAPTRIMFTTATNNTTVGGAERMRIDSEGNVGIGDTSPASLLTVGNGDLFQVNSSGAIAAATGITSSGSITFSGLSTAGIVHNSAAGLLSTSLIVDADITNATISNAKLANSSMNFGGVSLSLGGSDLTPAFNLADATGLPLTTGVSGILPIANGGTGSATQNFVDLTTAQSVGGAKTFTATPTFNNATYSALFTGGNVGIGTATPNAPLDIQATPSNYALTLRGDATSGQSITRFMNSTVTAERARITALSTGELTFGTNTSGLERMRIDESGFVGIGTTTPETSFVVNKTSGTGYLANIRSAVDGIQGGFALHQLNTSYTNPFSVNSGDGFTTGDPVHADFVGGILPWSASGGVALIGNSNAAGVPGLAFEANQGVEGTTRAALWLNAVTSDGLGNKQSLASGVNVFQVANNGSQLLTVRGSGNVGIGDTTPASMLTVGNGDLFQVNSSGAIAASTGITTTGQVTLSGSAANIALGSNYLSGDGGDEGIYVDASGNVGIGTTGPTGQLHVFGTGAQNIYFGHDTTSVTNTQRGFRISPWTDGSVYIDTKTYTGGALNFRIGEGTEQGSARTWMSVDATNGNIGIGDTTPTVKLDVGDNSVVDGAALFSLEDVNSTCTFNANTGTPSCGSDITLKKNVQDFSHALEKISALRLVTYNWNSDTETEMPQTGFIAQEVAEVLPELVSDGAWIDGSTKKFLNIGGMTPYLVGAVKELHVKIGELALDDALFVVNGAHTQNEPTFVGAFLARLVTWFANTANGIGTFFANRIVAQEEICIDGECLTADDVRSLKALAAIGATTVQQGGNPSTSPGASTPTITIIGNSPAIIAINDTYSDLGATAKNTAGADIGYTIEVDGVSLQSVILDTSTDRTYTITYYAEEGGVVVTAERTVIVGTGEQLVEGSGGETLPPEAPVEEPVPEAVPEPAPQEE